MKVLGGKGDVVKKGMVSPTCTAAVYWFSLSLLFIVCISCTPVHTLVPV